MAGISENLKRICENCGYFDSISENSVMYVLDGENYEYSVEFNYNGTEEDFVESFLYELACIGGMDYMSDKLGECEDLNDIGFYLEAAEELENDVRGLESDLSEYQTEKDLHKALQKM